jgi:hypothetical protein
VCKETVVSDSVVAGLELDARLSLLVGGGGGAGAAPSLDKPGILREYPTYSLYS